MALLQGVELKTKWEGSIVTNVTYTAKLTTLPNYILHLKVCQPINPKYGSTPFFIHEIIK
ncbi:hypothetical protein DVA76_19050 [Acinetobacter baumannii]|nr:hypothetical protein DVA76_19050 [Acinetobacter baumannii]